MTISGDSDDDDINDGEDDDSNVGDDEVVEQLCF